MGEVVRQSTNTQAALLADPPSTGEKERNAGKTVSRFAAVNSLAQHGTKEVYLCRENTQRQNQQFPGPRQALYALTCMRSAWPNLRLIPTPDTHVAALMPDMTIRVDGTMKEGVQLSEVTGQGLNPTEPLSS